VAGTEGESDGPALRYEVARDELAEVVGKLEAGGATLEESLALWERGEALAAICQQWLDGARERLAQAVDKSRDSAGGPS
jgi:exodeoxyribonuclease VII small subunit